MLSDGANSMEALRRVIAVFLKRDSVVDAALFQLYRAMGRGMFSTRKIAMSAAMSVISQRAALCRNNSIGRISLNVKRFASFSTPDGDVTAHRLEFSLRAGGNAGIVGEFTGKSQTAFALM